MKRVLTAVLIAVAVLVAAVPAWAAASNTPPAGMTSTCSATRTGTSVTESGVLRYADGSPAAGFTVNVLWQQLTYLDWVAPNGGGATSGTDGSWSQTYTVQYAQPVHTTINVMWKQGSKLRFSQVGVCDIS